MSENEDEYLDFAPSKHAVREAFAFCTVAARWGCGDGVRTIGNPT